MRGGDALMSDGVAQFGELLLLLSTLRLNGG